MNKQYAYPKVLLVGRTNVGKSTLFNRLTTQKRSIVFNQEGVTRDYLEEVVTWNDKTFLLVDTGGLSFQRDKDTIGQQVQEKVLQLLSQATLLLFVVDGKNGLTDEDTRIATVLHKTKKPVVVLINKADNQHALEENTPDFYQLGFPTLIPVSGIHGIGIAQLLQTIIDFIPLPEEIEAQKPTYKVVIIGRPNVGKSSLANLLIQHERSIVSDIAGTTREPISDVTFHCNDLVQITDTAGVRRPRKIEEDLEHLMIQSSMQAIKEADIVLIMIDASEGKIADQELKLLFYAYEQRKMIMAIINKTDLLAQDAYKKFTLDQSIEEYEFILKKIPTVWISCLTKKNVYKIWDQLQQLWARCQQTFDPLAVNEIVQKELSHVHLYHTEIELKVDRIEQVKETIPTFMVYVNHPKWFGPSELGCIENILRKHYDLLGCPLHFILREAA